MQDGEIYAAIGEDGFQRLIAAFYRQVPHDDILGPMYPADDMEGAEQRLRDFLIGRFGGPQRYIEQRGHPRLRMRHNPYRVGPIERDAWLRCMHTAIASIDDETLDPPHRQALVDYMEMAAQSMMNSPI